ncbi:MAG TPA: glycosyl transferase [Clostridiales bacterium]|nr:glycosyl transferase [Clostridiales bacterium]
MSTKTTKQKNGSPKKKNKKLKHRIKLTIQIAVFLILLVIAIGILYFYIAYGKTILDLQTEAKQKVGASTEETFRASQTSIVYGADGEVLTTVKAEKDVYYLEYHEIPQFVIDAMLVTEDKKFFDHGGVDYFANVRAAIALIKHKGKITQGASTITQQLARNVFLTHKVTYERKIGEIFIAQELERKYSKTQIMEYYLNEIYFANGHYGIQAAAQGYFGEGIDSLSMSQMAFLCAIPNNPTLYDPLTKMENTLKRRDRILKQMYDDGKISLADYTKATRETITLNRVKTERNSSVETYIYYCTIRALMKEAGFEFRYQFDSKEDEEAYDEAYDEMYGSYQKALYSQGYRIYTSIDMSKQKQLQAAVDEELKNFTEVNEEGVYQMQGAAVCIDNDTGKVVAIVGGRSQDLGGYTLNRAYQSFRQPGSSIKPLIVYTPSFERDYTPASDVVDKYTKDGPRNSGNTYLGKIKLQKAVEKSINTVAWKLFEELTPKVGLSYLLDMNFARISERDYVPAASLGGLTNGVSPLEMAAGYETLENDGIYREPTCIVKITDAEDQQLAGDDVQTKQVYKTRAARIMTEVLTGVIKNGTARGLGLSHTISAGKTGTTNDKKDGWFVGYTPYYTTSVWVGYDIPKKVSDLQGASYPGRIWHNFMDEIHTSSMDKGFEYYDWRSPLKEQQEEEERRKKEEEEAAALTQAAEEEAAALTQAAQDARNEEETQTGDDQDDGWEDDDTGYEDGDGGDYEEYPEEPSGITEPPYDDGSSGNGESGLEPTAGASGQNVYNETGNMDGGNGADKVSGYSAGTGVPSSPQ